jgi:hypothetical protein
MVVLSVWSELKGNKGVKEMKTTDVEVMGNEGGKEMRTTDVEVI